MIVAIVGTLFEFGMVGIVVFFLRKDWMRLEVGPNGFSDWGSRKTFWGSGELRAHGKGVS